MAYSNYSSLSTGAPRVKSRAIFYIILGILLGGFLLVSVFKKGNTSSKHHDDILKYRAEHANDLDHIIHTHQEKQFEPQNHATQHQNQNQNTNHPGHGHANDHFHHYDDHGHEYYYDHHDDHHQTQHSHHYDHEHYDDHHLDYHHGDHYQHEFHTTDEWQIVPDNVVLPAGLEIKLDPKTGQKLARNHPAINHPVDNNNNNLPPPQEYHSEPLVGNSKTDKGTVNYPPANHHDDKTIIEHRLEEIMSQDINVQKGSLEHLVLESHRLPIGEAITHARNFFNLIRLMETGCEIRRLQAVNILAASLHDNKGAIEGALLSSLISHVTDRIGKETDAQIKRRLVAIITSMAEGNLPGTLHQFIASHGFNILEKVISTGLDPASFERIMVLLATLAREESHDKASAALTLLDRFLPQAVRTFDEIHLDAFQPICTAEQQFSPPRYTNIAGFCKRYIPIN